MIPLKNLSKILTNLCKEVQNRLSIIIKLVIPFLLVSLSTCRLPHNGLPTPVENVPMDLQPKWSPDGRYLIYTHVDTIPDTTSGIKILDLKTGSNWFILKGLPWEYFNPTWSPDGKWILFNHNGDAIYKARLTDSMKIDSASIRFLVEGNNPDWSPCGELIAFDRPGDTSGVYIIDTAGMNERLVKYGYQPSWGSYCDKLLVKAFSVFIIDTSGNILRRLNFDPGSGSYDWSTDGRYIVFERNPNEPRGIFVVDTSENIEIKLYDTNNREYSYPSFSPTSDEIAFNSWNPEHTRIVLWIIKRDGRNLRQVTF